MVEPVDPFERGELDRFERAPGPASSEAGYFAPFPATEELAEEAAAADDAVSSGSSFPGSLSTMK